MMKDQHVLADLSAYLDQELAPAERAQVSAHLEACGRCAGQLAELRATATLLAALPSPRPSRSLVPSLTPRWNWLRPMRSLSAVASGAFLMVFLVAAVAQSGSDLGGGPASPFTRTGPAAQPAAPGAAQDAAQAELKVATPTAAPVPAAAASASPAPTDDMRRQLQAATPTATAGAFAAQTSAADAEAAARQRGATPLEATRTAYGQEPPTPLIWLGLSLLAAILAGAAHWRLRGI